VSEVTGTRSRISARGEKSLRLVTASLIATVVGIAAVITDSETLGFVAIGIVLAAILAGPIIARILGIGRD
jgi:hypothetical protein